MLINLNIFNLIYFVIKLWKKILPKNAINYMIYCIFIFAMLEYG